MQDGHVIFCQALSEGVVAKRNKIAYLKASDAGARYNRAERGFSNNPTA